MPRVRALTGTDASKMPAHLPEAFIHIVHIPLLEKERVFSDKLVSRTSLLAHDDAFYADAEMLAPGLNLINAGAAPDGADLRAWTVRAMRGLGMWRQPHEAAMATSKGQVAYELCKAALKYNRKVMMFTHLTGQAGHEGLIKICQELNLKDAMTDAVANAESLQKSGKHSKSFVMVSKHFTAEQNQKALHFFDKNSLCAVCIVHGIAEGIEMQNVSVVIILESTASAAEWKQELARAARKTTHVDMVSNHSDTKDQKNLLKVQMYLLVSTMPVWKNWREVLASLIKRVPISFVMLVVTSVWYFKGRPFIQDFRRITGLSPLSLPVQRLHGGRAWVKGMLGQSETQSSALEFLEIAMKQDAAEMQRRAIRVPILNPLFALFVAQSLCIFALLPNPFTFASLLEWSGKAVPSKSLARERLTTSALQGSPWVQEKQVLARTIDEQNYESRRAKERELLKFEELCTSRAPPMLLFSDVQKEDDQHREDTKTLANLMDTIATQEEITFSSTQKTCVARALSKSQLKKHRVGFLLFMAPGTGKSFAAWFMVCAYLLKQEASKAPTIRWLGPANTHFSIIKDGIRVALGLLALKKNRKNQKIEQVFQSVLAFLCASGEALPQTLSICAPTKVSPKDSVILNYGTPDTTVLNVSTATVWIIDEIHRAAENELWLRAIQLSTKGHSSLVLGLTGTFESVASICALAAFCDGVTTWRTASCVWKYLRPDPAMSVMRRLVSTIAPVLKYCTPVAETILGNSFVTAFAGLLSVVFAMTTDIYNFEVLGARWDHEKLYDDVKDVLVYAPSEISFTTDPAAKQWSPKVLEDLTESFESVKPNWSYLPPPNQSNPM
jgi:hypothetical protein